MSNNVHTNYGSVHTYSYAHTTYVATYIYTYNCIVLDF